MFLPVEFQRSAFSGFAQRNRRPPFGGERKRIANRQVRGAHKRRAPPRRPFSLACYVPDSNPSKALGLWTGFALRRSAATAPHPGAKRGSESLTRRGFFVPWLSSLTAGGRRRPKVCMEFYACFAWVAESAGSYCVGCPFYTSRCIFCHILTHAASCVKLWLNDLDITGKL